jgi:hypothetical protein
MKFNSNNKLNNFSWKDLKNSTLIYDSPNEYLEVFEG